MTQNAQKKDSLTGNSRLTVLQDRRLPDDGYLHDRGPFLEPMTWTDTNKENNLTTLPRTLRGLSHIVDTGLCHRCGSCIGICPTNVLSLDEEEYPYVKNLSACTDCNLCVKVCPGDEFDFKRYHEEKYGTQGDITATHGVFLESTLSHSTDPDIQARSTSGGTVTQILLHLLETSQIDGAIVITSDENTLWKGKPIVARTREEILSAMKSKYAISPTNSVFSEIRNIPGKYALVGLPCQIHGFVKAAELDSRIKERVVLTIGLFCHAAVEHEAFRIIWNTLGEKTKTATRFISRIGKHPGTPHIELQDGSLSPVYFPHKKGYRPSSMEVINIIYRLYTPKRCLTCFDATAEFADISIGDPWMAPPDNTVDFKKGWSFGLLRSEKGKKIMSELQSTGKIATKDVTRSEAHACNHHMATEKRYRAFRTIQTLRRQGRAIPAYGPPGFELPKQSGKQFVKTELHMLSHIFCYLPHFRAHIFRFILSDGGYFLLWLNNKRRTLRFWTRDTLFKIKTSLFGRK